MCFLAFSHKYSHNHASAEVRGENTPERKVASTRDQTHNHQVMSPKRSPQSPGLFSFREDKALHSIYMVGLKMKKISKRHFKVLNLNRF